LCIRDRDEEEQEEEILGHCETANDPEGERGMVECGGWKNCSHFDCIEDKKRRDCGSRRGLLRAARQRRGFAAATPRARQRSR
jgi:hypothetical protein